MKKIIVTNEKYSVSIRLLTVKDNIHTDLRTSHAQFLGKGSQYRGRLRKLNFVIKRVHYR